MFKLLLLSIAFSVMFAESVVFAATPEKATSPSNTRSSKNTARDSFGVQSIDPFQKVEVKSQKEESAPNPFLELLQQKVVLPDKKRPARKAQPPKKSAQQKAAELLEQQMNEFNPFEDSTEGSMYSKEHQELLLSNPFAAGDPFAHEYLTESGKKAAQDHPNISTRTANNTNAPNVVKFEPAQEAKDVDAAEVKEIRVTFNQNMSQNGFSWCGGGEMFPETTGKPRWLDKRTCVLPVKLVSGKTYELSINCLSAKNFRSEKGVPVEPVPYSFSTSK